MTGFGKASGEHNGQAITVEVSAVNSRYLDCNLRLPPSWNALDPILKQTVRKHIQRGKLTVTVNRKRTMSTAKSVKFDAGIAQQYLDAAKELTSMIGSYETLPLSVLAQLDGVLYHEETDEDLGTVEPVLVAIAEEALARLDEMRANEGKALAEEIRQRINLIRQGVATIEARLPELNAMYEERLRTRINELRTETSITEERMAIEVALMAEKSDVTEEVVRLKAHLEHLEQILDAKEPAGRKLDFLTQEVHREVNTLGVKTRDAQVAKDVLGLKSEVEKMREQIQNIE
jgi:uncharacterized protein (TIGR00255 family)